MITFARVGLITRALVVLLLLASLEIGYAGPARAGAPVARWVADDWAGGTANWVDRVGGKVATVSAAANSPAKIAGSIAGSTGSGLVFDGVNDHFRIAAGQSPVQGATSMTVAAFFKTSQGASAGCCDGFHWTQPGPINGEASGSPNDWGLTYNTAGEARAFFNNAIAPSPAVSVIDGQPHTMILTWRASENVARLYVDGVFAGSAATGGAGGIDNNAGLAFGANNEGGGPDRFFSGTIGELRFYTTIEDPAAVHSELVTAPSPPTPPPATAYHSLVVNKAGSGSGHVSGDTYLQIDCGSDCSSMLASHTYGVLEASADEGSVFAGWSGDCLYVDDNDCTVHMTGSKSVTAIFETAEPEPTPTPTPEPEPTISPSPEPEPESFAVSVTLKLFRLDGLLVARGHVSSDEPSCMQGVPVEIHRIRNETMVLKGTTITGPNGNYRLELGAPKGTYVAVIPAHSPSGSIECQGNESGTARKD